MTETRADGAVERTLVLLKPDALGRGMAGRVISRLEDALLKIVGAKLMVMDEQLTRSHYFDLEERYGAAIYRITADFMQSGPVLALAVEGVDAVANVRRLAGATYPNQAAPGTLRGDLAHQSKAYATANDAPVANLLHASGNPDEAKRELDLWFAADELADYSLLADKYIT